jgi:hypothetical protein
MTYHLDYYDKTKWAMVDSCVFIEIILNQPNSILAENLIEEYNDCAKLGVTITILREVLLKIEKEIENIGNQTYSLEEYRTRNVESKRKELYDQTEELLSKCFLINPYTEHENAYNFTRGIDSVRFDDKRADRDKKNIFAAMTQEFDYFITFDGAIKHEKNKIKGISRNKLEIVSS